MQPRYTQIVIGIVSLGIGIFLLVRAHAMAHAIGDQVQELVNGAPTNRTTYFQIAGGALTIFGAVYILLGIKGKA